MGWDGRPFLCSLTRIEEAPLNLRRHRSSLVCSRNNYFRAESGFQSTSITKEEEDIKIITEEQVLMLN